LGPTCRLIGWPANLQDLAHLQVLLDLRPQRLPGRLLALLVDHRDVALEVDELLARHLRRFDLPLAAGEMVADLVSQRLLRLLLAGDDEHGNLAIDVDLADVLFLELPGLRVAVQVRDRSGLTLSPR